MSQQGKFLLLFSSFLLATTLRAQTADSIFISGITSTGTDTIVNTLMPQTVHDSMAIADTITTDSIHGKDITELFTPDSSLVDSIDLRDLRFGLYRKVFIEPDSGTIHYWTYSPNTYELPMQVYDSTNLDFLSVYKAAYRDGKINLFLSQVGTAIKSQEFFRPNEKTRFLFAQSFTPYMHQPSTELFYNAKQPFTCFEYYSGPKEEQNINLTHTQNVTKGLNLFFKYNSTGGEGEYVNNKTRVFSGSFGGSYTQGRFATHAGYFFSKINNVENGGITDTYYVGDTLVSEKEVPMRLSDARTVLKDKQLFFNQKIGFVKGRESDSIDTGGYWFSLQYTFERQKSGKLYTDKTTSYLPYGVQRNTDSLNVYEHNYSNKRSTLDTCYYNDNHNQIRLNLEEIKNPYAPFGLYGAIGFEKQRYYYFNIDTLFNNTQAKNHKNKYFEGGLHRTRGILQFAGSARLYVSGYKQGDFSMSGYITQFFGKKDNAASITINGLMEKERADYFYTNYQSNHFKWNNNFTKDPLTTKVSAKLNIPQFRTVVESNIALLNNYIYLNSKAMPTQAKSEVAMFDIHLRNHIDAAGFHLISRINLQYSSDTAIIQVPTISAYESLFYEREIYFKETNGKLKFQLGVDLTYWSKYYAPMYNPALALFHNQNNLQIGNYPFIGAFVHVQIKEVRFFVRMNQLDRIMFENKSNMKYYTAPLYPVNGDGVNFGIVWPFYN